MNISHERNCSQLLRTGFTTLWRVNVKVTWHKNYEKYTITSIAPCLSMISISSSICCGSLPFRTAVRTSCRCFLFYKNITCYNQCILKYIRVSAYHQLHARALCGLHTDTNCHKSAVLVFGITDVKDIQLSNETTKHIKEDNIKEESWSNGFKSRAQLHCPK